MSNSHIFLSFVRRFSLSRNIGIVAHINAGKTTTTERILYLSGSTDTVGDVDRGNTVTDYLIQERNRGITITSAAVSLNWNKHRINLIDTPGHVDFTIEVERSLSVLDGAVTILDASAGVEAQTITVWNQASKYRLPNVIFLNKHDKPQADYRACMKDLKQYLGMSAALTQIPVQDGSKLSSIVDIISRKHLSWENPELDKGKRFSSIPLGESQLDTKYIHLSEEAREHLVNHLSDMDDEFASHVLECDTISAVKEDLMIRSLRRATLDCRLCPVLLGSSFKHLGVQQLLDAIVLYLPTPQERALQISKEFNLQAVESRENCAFIFKIMHDKRLGPLTYLRVNNGSISKSQKLFNIETGQSELIKRVYRPFADELREIDQSAHKDDIVVVTGISEARTGEILGDKSLIENYEILNDEDSSSIGGSGKESMICSDTDQPFRMLQDKIIVPQISSMVPVYFCSIESRTSSQQLRLEKALNCLAREDPSFSYDIDSMGVTTIRGMGKLHLEIIRDRIQSEHGIDSLLGPLQISYRETIETSATEELSINRMVNGVNNTLTIQLYVRPKPGAGLWTNKMLRLDLSGDNSLGKLRHTHRRAIENGVASALSHGPSMGYPVIDCDVLLLDFKANGRCGLPVVSSAASQCLAAAMARCSPVLLEPIMLLEVVTPCEHNGIILSDLTSTRRAIIVSTTPRNNGSIVTRAHAPLSSMANYSEFLRISTSGRGNFSMSLHSYSAMSAADRQSVTRV